MLHSGLAEMQVLFCCYKRFLQDSGVKGFMFENDVKALTTTLKKFVFPFHAKSFPAWICATFSCILMQKGI